MGSVVACIIARTVSKRLPGKVLKKVTDELTMLEFIVERIKKCEKVDEIYLCTSKESVDDPLEHLAKLNGIKIYRGSADKVIERLLEVAKISRADYLIRVTGDNVFTSFEYLSTQIKIAGDNNHDYVRVTGVPLGSTAEVMKVKALQKCATEIDQSVSEYLMLFMFDPGKYNCGVITVLRKNYSHYTLTVDTPRDFERTLQILRLFKDENKVNIQLKEILHIIDDGCIQYINFDQTNMVKLPYDKFVSYKEFQNDMSHRVKRSKQYILY